MDRAFADAQKHIKNNKIYINGNPIRAEFKAMTKEKALKNLGLNMSTFVNMAIKQLIYHDGLPFEARNPKPNRELLEALQEGEDILSGKVKAKSYHNMYEMLEDLKK